MKEKYSVGYIKCCILKKGRKKAWGCTVFYTETGEKYRVDDIECCVLKYEKNRAWVIYSVVY